MKDYLSMNKEQLHSELHNVTQQYQEYKAMNLNLDMSRGKPCTEQLNLSNELLNIHQYIGENGFDSRNYGMLAGMPEARRFFAELLGLSSMDEVIVAGNSSLSMMYSLCGIDPADNLLPV